MRLSELFESISSVVYHATSFPSANKMLQSNMIKGPEISFTRSLEGAYHSSNRMIGIIFILDGTKINQNYKGGPVGTENFMWDDGDEHDPDDKTTWSHTGRDNGQLEDRVKAPDGLNSLSKFITGAIVYAPIEHVQDDTVDEFADEGYSEQIGSVDEVVAQLKELGVPIRYVASQHDLLKKSSDPEGFANVIKHIKGESPDQAATYILRFSDYSKYNPEDDDLEDVEYFQRTITADNLEDAVKAGLKLVDDNKDVDLDNVENEDTGESWEA